MKQKPIGIKFMPWVSVSVCVRMWCDRCHVWKTAGDTHQNVANKWQMSMSMDTNILHNISCWLMNHPAEENDRANERTRVRESVIERNRQYKHVCLPFVTLSFFPSFSFYHSVTIAPLLISDATDSLVLSREQLYKIMKTICPQHTFQWKYDSPCIIIIISIMSISFCVYYSLVVCTRAPTEMKRDEGKERHFMLLSLLKNNKINWNAQTTPKAKHY